MKPFAGMPYGLPPTYCYPLTEGWMYLLFTLCFYHAWKKGNGPTGYLLGGLGFGLLLEYVNVATSAGYVYGEFWVMFGIHPNDIPLCIGMGWAVIMYTARLISDKCGLSLGSAAALDTLIAINIDLSMDVTAYRLHMWHWDWEHRGGVENSLTGQWFGVPYGNFYGWLLVVFFYSAFSRLLEKSRFLKTSTWEMARPILVILLSQVALFIALFPLADWLKRFGITSAHRLVALLVVFVLLTVLGWQKRAVSRTDKLPVVAWMVPAWFHLYFTAWFLVAGFYLENPAMTLWTIANLFAGIVLHFALFRAVRLSQD